MDKFGVLRARTFTVRIHWHGAVRKLFKLGFTGSDGSIWIAFPYFEESHGIAGIAQTTSGEVKLAEVGRVTSHRVKYTHHRSGEALFSLTGKVLSDIRKPSIPLSVSEGHLCTVQVNGLAAFAEDPAAQPDAWINIGCQPASNHTVTFDAPWEESPAMKFMIRCYNKRRLRPLMQNNAPGPMINIVNLGPAPEQAVLLSAPKTRPEAATYLVVQAMRCPGFTSSGRPCLVFIGGFDPPEVASDPTRETSFLALAYPIDKHEELRTTIGTIDLDGELGRELPDATPTR